MRVIINEAINQAQSYQVSFSTEYGNATALWRGNEPQVNKEYFTEFEIPDVLYWQKDIAATEEVPSIILSENGIVHIVALLESIEDDGYAVLRLGDNIISIESQGEPSNVGNNVKLTTNNLLIYEVVY